MLNIKQYESIMIGDDVVITVVALDADHVGLGISTPRAVTVDRAEVAEAKAEIARQQATPTAGDAPC